MRRKVAESPFCNLRCQCEVVDMKQEGDRPVIEYEDEKRVLRKILGSFVVGADGKKGVVRKNFLEESAGIKQVEGSYRYDGTWIAANLKLKVQLRRHILTSPFGDLDSALKQYTTFSGRKVGISVAHQEERLPRGDLALTRSGCGAMSSSRMTGTILWMLRSSYGRTSSL